MTFDQSKAPTSQELLSLVGTVCSSRSLKALVSQETGITPSKQMNTGDQHEHVIVINKRSKAQRASDATASANLRYGKEFRRNCFTQFEKLHSRYEPFYSHNSDEDAVITAEIKETV